MKMLGMPNSSCQPPPHHRVGDDKVDVEMQATVDHTDGSGDCNGLITVTFGGVVQSRFVIRVER